MTTIEANLSAFGEVVTITPTPVCQIDHCYGFNSYNLSSTTVGSGTVTSEIPLLVLQTGTSTNGEATVFSKRQHKYKAGQGACARFTAIFSPPKANSKQCIGVSDKAFENCFFFGYKDLDFGVFCIRDYVETFVKQKDFNIKSCLTNLTESFLDTTKGNVYQIKWQYLGFGAIYFYIENSKSGLFELCHVIRYANNNTNTSVHNPSFSICMNVKNTGNNTNMVLKNASCAIFNEGIIKYLGPQLSYYNSKSNITSQTNIFTMKNCSSFNSHINQSQIKIRNVSFCGTANSGNTIIILRIIQNATLTNSTFAVVDGSTSDNGTTITNGNLTVSFDTVGTFTGGTVVFSSLSTTNNTTLIDLIDQDIIFNPNDTLTFSIQALSQVTGAITVNYFCDL